MSKVKRTQTRMAGDCAVVTLEGGGGAYKRVPCSQCPWRVDQTGSFPAEAFRHSAATAYDMAEATFACHMAGAEHPAICAGFLMRGADHNLDVRMKCARGAMDFNAISDGGVELHDSYRAMAVANGCDEDEEVLRPCR